MMVPREALPKMANRNGLFAESEKWGKRVVSEEK